jgi:hypothetical protein
MAMRFARSGRTGRRRRRYRPVGNGTIATAAAHVRVVTGGWMGCRPTTFRSI